MTPILIKRPIPQFERNQSYAQRLVALKEQRNGVINRTDAVSIAILGAGPAGLCRCIEGLLQGHRITVLEARSQERYGTRENTVALSDETIDWLEYYGVYQYLLEQHQIFPAQRQTFFYRQNTPSNTFNVQLKDLEAAMEAVIQDLAPDFEIIYNRRVRALEAHGTVDLLFQEGDPVRDINIIVIAEGAKSTTYSNVLQGSRDSVLPQLPAIAAIFKDKRSKIVSFSAFFSYVGLTLRYTAISIYYYAIFFFKFVFQKERLWLMEAKIAGAVVLPTPNLNYVGCSFNSEEERRFKTILDTYNAALALHKKDPNHEENRQAFERAHAQKEDYICYWSSLSLCAVNVMNVLNYIAGKFLRNGASWQWTSFVPYDHSYVTSIGADRATCSWTLLDSTPILVTGDTLATVDPATGLGCNTAIKTVDLFRAFLQNYVQAGIDNAEQGINPKLLSHLRTYSTGSDLVTRAIHNKSRAVREAYRPDALLA